MIIVEMQVLMNINLLSILSEKSYSFLVLLWGLLLIFCISGCGDETLCNDIGEAGFKKDIVEFVNWERDKGSWCGDEYFPPAPPVTWNDTLANAAMVHSKDMANNEFLEHTGSDGSEPGDRILDAGYEWISCGENCGYGNDDETFGQSSEGAVKGWMDSPGHCSNIMNPDFIDIGVANVRGHCGDCDCLYWTMNLATPEDYTDYNKYILLIPGSVDLNLSQTNNSRRIIVLTEKIIKNWTFSNQEPNCGVNACACVNEEGENTGTNKDKKEFHVFPIQQNENCKIDVYISFTDGSHITRTLDINVTKDESQKKYIEKDLLTKLFQKGILTKIK